MQGSANLLRIRVGDWRVALTDDGTIIDIIKIAPRGEICKNQGIVMEAMEKNDSYQTVTIDGKSYVIAPLEWVEDLIKRAELAGLEETARRIRSGEEETFPSDIVEELVAGENPVAVYRKYRGITAKALAELAGISAPYLSEIEQGKKSGSPKVLKAIAKKLDVSIEDLV